MNRRKAMGRRGFLISAAGAAGLTGVEATAPPSESKAKRFHGVISVFDFMTAEQIADVRSGKYGEDVTAAIQAAIDHGVSLGAATIYFPAGQYKITSTVTVGNLSKGHFTSINLKGEGVVGTILAWHGSPVGTMLVFWRNKYASMSQIKCTNEAPKGTTIGTHLTGPAFGTQSNNLNFDNCAWQGFKVGVQAGGGALGTEAASELDFLNCTFTFNGSGFAGSGSGNTLNVWFRGSSFSHNSGYGVHLGTAGCCHFWGGGSHGNGTATIACYSNWQTTLLVEGFRMELVPPEIAIDFGSITAAVVQSCVFVSTTTVPAYDVFAGACSYLKIDGCQFGNGKNNGWRTWGSGVGNGQLTFLEMVGNRILGPDAFTINRRSTGIDKMRYSLRGNFYGGARHGVEEGTVVWPNRVGRVQVPTRSQYKTANLATPATLAGEHLAGADDVTLNMTTHLAGPGLLTTPTATQIWEAVPGAVAGLQFRARIINSSAGAHAWTLAANTGVTLSGMTLIAQNTWRDFNVTLASSGAAAFQNVGAGTFS